MADELVRWVGEALSTTQPDLKVSSFDFFSPFRAVFAAERCRSRRIYWFEEKWGRTILRQVLHPARTDKKEDRVLTTLPGKPDIASLRIIIANSSAGHILTGTRWEIYSDQACEHLVAQGRFDHIDLLPANPEEMERIQRSRTVVPRRNHESWDYDGFFLAHTCPQCRRNIIRDVLIFDPDMMRCPQCGPLGDPRKYKDTIQTMLRRLQQGWSGQLPTQDSTKPGFEVFLDMHATVVICWIVQYLAAMPLHGMFSTYNPNDFPPHAIEDCYNHSLLRLLEQEVTREAFLRHAYEYFKERWQQTTGADPLKELTPEQMGMMRRSWIEEEAKNFIGHVKTLQGFRTWFFTGKSQETNVKWARALVKAAAEIPGQMETFILDLGKKFLKEHSTRGTR